MAFAVVVERDDGTFYTAVAGRASGYASSTKAELTGLLAAILVSPRDKQVDIKIDNMAVVTQFQTLVKQRPYCTDRQKFRSPYSSWWSAVHNAYIHQGSMVSVSWVRGHQGNKGNEEADKAAKNAHNGILWELDVSKHNDLLCHATFNNVTAEIDLRQILKLQSAARIHQTWLRQNRTQANIRDWTKVEWRSSLSIIHNRNAPKGLFTSMSDCHNRAHRVKKLHGMLPTLTYMKRWRPDLYTDDTCRRCEQEPEDTGHLWKCPATMEKQKRKWQKTLESMNDIGQRIYNQARKGWDREAKIWIHSQQALPLYSRKPFPKAEPHFSRARTDHMWEILEATVSGVTEIRNETAQAEVNEENDLNAIATDITAEWTVQDLYQGLAPKILTTKWKKLCQTSTNIATLLACRLVSMIEEIGKKKIWKERCDITIGWEKEQGITTVRKRSRTQNEADGRPRGGNFMGPNPRHRQAQDTTAINKAADDRILKSYLGRTRLDLMERLGGVKFTMVETPG